MAKNEPPKNITVAYLLTLPREEQNRLMDAAMEDAAPLYAADLALPPHERELTPFEALNDYDPIYDSPEDYLLTEDGEAHRKY